MKRLATLLVLLAASSTASAETPTDSELGIAPHVNIGFELLGGRDVFQGGTRAHVGIDKALGSHGVQPSIGVGGTFGLSSLSVSDPRALDGTVTIGHFDWGPEAQLGLRWVDGGAVDSRVFASFAYLFTNLDDRLMLDPIEGVQGTRGMRASLGASWADRAGRAAVASGHGEDDRYDWMILLAPQQLEITFERSAGSDRYGVTMSWGI